MAKPRTYKSVLGIPLWIIVGLAIFIIFSAIYDWVVGDRSWGRYVILGSSLLIILITLILHLIPANTIGKMAGKQLGG